MNAVCTGFFNTLANRTRLNILYALRKGEQSVNDIVKKTGYEQSLVSHNLKLLRRCEFVTMRVNGKQRIYKLNQDTIEPLFKIVDKHRHSFCNDKACEVCTHG